MSKFLVDQTGRQVNYLRLSVTDHCNLNCFYCRENPENCPEGQRNEMSKKDFVLICRVAAELGVSKVRLTGGEPLLSPDIVDIVQEISSIPGIKDLSMTTNAILLPRYARSLAKAGLNRVNISLDSLEEITFKQITNGGALKLVLNGIDASLEAGLDPIKINVVLLKGINDHEIGEFAKLTLDRNLHVRFIEYMPVCSELGQWNQYYLSLDKVKEECSRLGNFVPAQNDHGGGPAQYFRIEGGHGKIGLITPLSRHFCGKCNRLRVTADAKLKPCLFSENEIDLAPLLEVKNAEQLLKECFFAGLNLKPDPLAVASGSEERAKQFKGARKMNQIGG